MKLVFFSSSIGHENDLLDELLLSLINKNDPRFTYIPECSIFSHDDYIDFINKFNAYGVSKFFYFPIDHHINKISTQLAFDSDCIHLAGGNTFSFLWNLREKNLMKKLRNFAKDGGVLCGTSAGSIILTKDIKLAGYPSFDKDDNEVGIKKLSSLNLVDFYFFPHFKSSKRYVEAIKSFSIKNKQKILACKDDSGVVVQNEKVEIVGDVYLFEAGKYHKLKSTY
ncbi:Type 1 glutamine amidotransferase-like domain-containing protein [Bacteriovoracaceae bacterium]|nr:Type 1 glutamine amidotransferase-like domain-containing protein [Bacteriovoracaceae bacterium]